MTYFEHPSKVTRWSCGEVIGPPDSKQGDRTVWFAFEDHWEGLLAQQLDADSAVVRSVPFFIYNLALGDVVSTMKSAEGGLVATGRIKPSGNVTFRVVFETSLRWLGVMEDLEPHDCWFDVRSPTFMAISTPPEHAQAVADYLHGREQAGDLQYDGSVAVHLWPLVVRPSERESQRI